MRIVLLQSDIAKLENLPNQKCASTRNLSLASTCYCCGCCFHAASLQALSTFISNDVAVYFVRSS